jgi:hypothetical protein
LIVIVRPLHPMHAVGQVLIVWVVRQLDRKQRLRPR